MGPGVVVVGGGGWGTFSGSVELFISLLLINIVPRLGYCLMVSDIIILYEIS